jgi:hypothetical protein
MYLFLFIEPFKDEPYDDIIVVHVIFCGIVRPHALLEHHDLLDA